jgi:hypothetical protein
VRLIKPKARIAAVVIFAAAAIVGLIVPGWDAQPADAANASGFDAGNIISDANFYNSGSMDAGQLQAFIIGQGANCTNNGSIPCLKNLTVGIPAIAANAQCASVSPSSGRTAGDAIAIVAEACGISPQVLLVLIEKEQSIVTTAKPSSWMYAETAGFACPDSAPCNEDYSGFFSQIYAAAKQFQIYRQYPGSFNYQAGRNNNIQYSPTASCGTKLVYIQNVATASLYDYTPYTPNAAALANLYGIGDGCSAYGNRNFWRIYTDWFGDPTGHALQCPSFEGCYSPWQTMGTTDQAVYTGPNVQSLSAQSGGSYLAFVPHQVNASVYQDVSAAVAPGGVYQAKIWIRSLSPSDTATGTLALWGLGRTANEVGTQSFSVGGSWTQVTANLQVQQSHDFLRLQVYFDKPQMQVLLDTASLAQIGTQPRSGAVGMNSASFESGLGAWTDKNGFVNLAVYSGGAQDGSRYLETNTPTPGHSVSQDVPLPTPTGFGYTATVWVRGAQGQTFNGQLNLWGIGSTAVAASTPFLATGNWQKISVTLPASAAGSSMSTLRVEIYEFSVGPNLDIDNATLTSNALPDGSFESNASGWVQSGAGTNLATYPQSVVGVAPIDDSKLGATNVASPGGSVYVDRSRILSQGTAYTARIWLRTQDPSKTFTGTLALWEMSPTGSVPASINVTVTGTWQEFVVTKTIQSSTSTTLRLQLYEDTPGTNVFMDGASLY